MTDLDKYPCDRSCNWADGPAEDCSKHGRPPAEVWKIVGDVSSQRDAALARIARVEALHPRILGECHTCSDEKGPKPWPCATVRALTEGENDGR